jgi:Tol biopolymer transport system component
MQMTASDSGTINLGQAVRGGLRLRTIDIVALVHDVCLQLEVDGAKKLPSKIDELSINDAGSVVMQSGRPTPTIRTAVATLLDALLATTSDEADAVPRALSTLPARLRAAGNAAKSSDIKDLLTILRWHIPHDPRQVLRELSIRARLAGLHEPDVVIDEFAAEAPAAVAAPHVNTRRRRWPLAYAAVLAALLACGYAGYRVTLNTPAATVAQDAMASEQPAASASAPGSPAVAPPAAPRVIVREQAPALEEPRPIALAVNGGAFSPSFAEGRRTLLFHAGHNSSGRLFSASLDEHRRASAITPLLGDHGRMYHVRLSPDGTRLAFDSDRDGERAVYIADRSGARVERVSGHGYAAVPSWSPDNRTLAFVRGEPTQSRVWNLWLRDLASGAVTRLTNFRSGQVWGASWFADSTRYAYSHDDRLLIADRAGRQQASFAAPIRGRLLRTPAVSPDGSRIVFQVYRDGVWVVDVATAQMRRVLDDPTAEEFAWDPDGRHVAYHSRRDGRWRIWLMPI